MYTHNTYSDAGDYLRILNAPHLESPVFSKGASTSSNLLMQCETVPYISPRYPATPATPNHVETSSCETHDAPTARRIVSSPVEKNVTFQLRLALTSFPRVCVQMCGFVRVHGSQAARFSLFCCRVRHPAWW